MKKSAIKTVTSLEKTKVGRVYATSNYSLFKHLGFNRGEDNGVDVKRVTAFQKMLESGKFYARLPQVIINLKGLIVDGHHRKLMLESLGEPIKFIITDEPAFNEGTETEIMIAVSELNGTSSKWNSKAHFDAAVKMEVPLAMRIKHIKTTLDTKYGVKKGMVSPSRIYGVITRELKALESNLKTVGDYQNESILNLSNEKLFIEELEFIYGVIAFAMHWNSKNAGKWFVQPFDVIRRVMPMIWNGDFTKENFYHNMVAKGIKCVNDKSAISEWGKTVTKKPIPKGAKVFTWESNVIK